jgi:hypothetical protein
MKPPLFKEQDAYVLCALCSMREAQNDWRVSFCVRPSDGDVFWGCFEESGAWTHPVGPVLED